MGLNKLQKQIYSHYRWFKGEKHNPYIGNTEMPLAASLWEYEREFHLAFLDRCNITTPLVDAYKQWKASFIQEYLPGKSPNPYGDLSNWELIFNNGRR